MVSQTLKAVYVCVCVCVCVCARTYQCVNGCQCSFLNGGYMQGFIIVQRINTERFGG